MRMGLCHSEKCLRKVCAKFSVPDHEFDIFGQMEFYETLWEGTPSVYKDYEKTKANVLSLKPSHMAYFDADGMSVKNCWKTVNGDTYYFDSNGWAVTGRRQIDGKWYDFDQNGVMLH